MSQVSDKNDSLDKNEIKEKNRSSSIDSLQYSEESINSPIHSETFSEDINSSENVKNNSNDCLFLEKPLEEDDKIFREDELINNSVDKLSEPPLMPNKKIKLNKCKGCYPIFQPNQEGHIGEYGCLGDYYDFIK